MKQNYSQDTQRRFLERRDELKWLYYELYHNDAQGFDYLCKLIGDYSASRDEGLRLSDRLFEADPEPFRGNDIVGMALYVDRFAGTLKGMIKKLDYLAELGVNHLHLMPLFESPQAHSDGGYAVSDYCRVQPALGTTADLKKLTDACRRRGIRCCTDLVMNHTSDEHAWAKAAREGDPEARARYFFFDSRDVPNGYECTVPQELPSIAPGNFTQLASGEFVMTTFYPYEWDLNYANPMVFNDMTENLLFLANLGVDVIRLDGLTYLWKELGTSCRNLKQVHTVVRMMRLVCEIVCPSVLLLGEVAMDPASATPFFGTADKPECDMLYNVTGMASTWNTVATRDVHLLKRRLEQVSQLPRERIFLNCLRNHDEISWDLDYNSLRERGMEEEPHKRFLSDYFVGRFDGSVSRGEPFSDDPLDARVCGATASLCGIEAALNKKDEKALALAVDADVMLHACLFTQSGVPVIYGGDEIGQCNDYLYHADDDKRFDRRYLHRGAFDSKLADQRVDPHSYPYAIFAALQKLIRLRADNDVFSVQAKCYPIGTGSVNVLGLCREVGRQKLLALFNFCEEERTVSFERKRVYTDLYTGERHNKKYIDLKPYGFVWALFG